MKLFCINVVYCVGHYLMQVMKVCFQPVKSAGYNIIGKFSICIHIWQLVIVIKLCINHFLLISAFVILFWRAAIVSMKDNILGFFINC